MGMGRGGSEDRRGWGGCAEGALSHREPPHTWNKEKEAVGHAEPAWTKLQCSDRMSIACANRELVI